MEVTTRRRNGVVVLLVFGMLAAIWLGCTANVLPKQIGYLLRANADVGAQPLPAGPDAYTQRDFLNACLMWHRKTTVEAYEEMGRKSPAWDEAAVQLLEMLARSDAGISDVPSPADLLEPTEVLLETDCNDPLVLSAIAWALRQNGRAAEAESFTRRAVKGHEEVKYPRCRAWLAPLLLANLCQAMGDEKQNEVDHWLDLSIKWVAEGAAEIQIAQDGQRAYWVLLRLNLYVPFNAKRQQIYEALAAQPGADPWIVNMVGGRYRRALAWEARGTNWTYEITEEGWKGFEKNLAKAREHFTKAWELQPEYPEAPSYMIGVVMGGGAEPGETERLWFDRAVAAQLDWEPAYSNLLYASRPRWGGSYEEMYDFGLECLATNRFDTIVPEQLYRAVWNIAEADCVHEFWRQKGVYENLQTVFEGVLADPYRTREPSRRLTLKMGRKYAVWTTQQTFQPAVMKSQYAAVAWRCGRYDDARRLFDELGEQVWPGAFTIAFGVPLSMAKGEVLAATGPLDAQVRKADKLHQEGQVSEALSIFEQLVEDSKDDTASTYLRDRVATLRLEDALSSGQWIDLAPPTDLTGWYKRGEWNVAGADTLELKPSGMHAALLISNMRAPQGFEIRGKIEMLPAQSGAVGGIVVGYSGGGRPYYTTVELHEKTSAAHIGTNFSSEQHVTVPLKGTNDFLVQVWDSKVTVYINGARAFADYKMEGGYAAPPGNQIGFCGWSYSANDSLVRYRNCQIRRLTQKPSEPPPGAKMGGAGGQDVCLWYELENIMSGGGWLTHTFWEPSGGRFLYPTPGAEPISATIALRPSGEWAVWVRARDETRGMRQGTATVNGKKSYIMGGTDSFQWIWYHVGFAEGNSVKLALARMVRDSDMDEWFDCLLLTNDLSFVPPGRYTSPAGYTAYNAAEDLEKGSRPAWIWWPTQPQPGTVGYYRKTFELDDVPSNAQLSMGAIGPYVVYLNGQEVAAGSKIGELSDYDVTELCQQGPNVIAVQVEHAGFLPGLRIHLRAELPGGSEADIVSDLTWKSTDAVVERWLEPDFDDTSWHRPWARIGEKHSVGY